jgi:cytoskeletal protein CcmA (bactofilin family)
VIFQDKKKPASPPEPSPPVAEKPEAIPSSSLLPKGKVQHSVISRDLTIVGDIVTSGDVKIEGRVDGNITCRTLTLGQEPVINSTVTAEAVHVCGKFSGEIRAASVVLAKNANVTGDIYQNHLEIQEGASIEGNVRRLDAAKSQEKIKTVKVA